MQLRDLVEAHRLVFSAKLYDHQGPIARGGRTNPPPPLHGRRWQNTEYGRGLTLASEWRGVDATVIDTVSPIQLTVLGGWGAAIPA